MQDFSGVSLVQQLNLVNVGKNDQKTKSNYNIGNFDHTNQINQIGKQRLLLSGISKLIEESQ